MREEELNQLVEKHYKTFEVYTDVFLTSFIEAAIITAIVYILSINFEIEFLNTSQVFIFTVFAYLSISFTKYVKFLLFKYRDKKEVNQNKHVNKQGEVNE